MQRRIFIYEVIFLTVMGFLFCGYGYLNFPILKEFLRKNDITYKNWQNNSAAIQKRLREGAVGRRYFIDLYGLSLRALQKNMVGNFEFIKDKNGIMQMPHAKPNVQPFLQSVAALHNRLKQDNIPLVFLEIPDRSKGLSISDKLFFFGQQPPELSQFLEQAKIDVLRLGEKPNMPAPRDFFLHVDGHLQTSGELWMAQELVQHLTEKYQIDFQNFKSRLDIASFSKYRYNFLGSHSRSSGKYFAGIDRFENYIPTFETNLSLIDKTGAVIRSGNFESVATNGYLQRKDNHLYTYWVTNYGQWPEPYYEYQNNLNPNAPKLLVIADSMFMRGEAFLSLVSSKVTVVDIRSINDIHYVRQSLDKERYDAVIICAADPNFFSRSFQAVH